MNEIKPKHHRQAGKLSRISGFSKIQTPVSDGRFLLCSCARGWKEVTSVRPRRESEKAERKQIKDRGSVQ